MQRARDQLLPGAGFAGDEHGAHVRREAPDEREQLLHRRPAADHAAELCVLRDLLLCVEQPPAPRGVVAHACEETRQPGEVERLGQVVDGAELDRLDGTVDRGVAAHQHDLAVRIGFAYRAAARRCHRRRAGADRRPPRRRDDRRDRSSASVPVAQRRPRIPLAPRSA